MTPLEEMDLSVRTFNCLRRAGINTVEGLTGMTREQFRSTLGLGSNCMNETEERMNEMGLSFREETAVQKQYMSDSAQYAYTVHAQIILGAQMVENGLYQMAKGFKIMRDEKLYKDMGYNSFEAYCETETHMTRRNVYRLIKVAENIPDGKICDIDVSNLGLAKLNLLTTLTDEQQTEVAQTTDLENTTVKELQEKIRELTGQRDEEKKLKEDWQKQARQEVDRSIKRIEDLNDTIDRLENKIKEMDSINSSLAEEIEDLEKQIDDLESQPIDVKAVEVIDVRETDEYRALQEKRQEAMNRIAEMTIEQNALKAKCADLEKQLTCDDDKKRGWMISCSEREMFKIVQMVNEHMDRRFKDIFSRRVNIP